MPTLRRVCAAQRPHPRGQIDVLGAMPGTAAQVAEKEAVSVEVEHRARITGLQDGIDLGLVERGSEVAPLVEHVQFAARARGVPLAHADRPGIGPMPEALRGQCHAQAQVMVFRAFAAAAHAGAATELVCKTASLARFQAERARTQSVRVGQLAQRLDGLALAAVGAVEPVEIARAQRLATDEAQQRPLDRVIGKMPRAQLPLAAQLAVEHRLQFLDQTRLEQQGAELAGGFDTLDATHLLRQAHFPRSAVVGLEMRHHAPAQAHALADVQRDAALPPHQVDTASAREVFDRRLQQGGQARRFTEQRGSRVLQCLGATLRAHRVEPGLQQQHIAHRAVAGGSCEAVTAHDRVQTMAARLGVQPARHAHRAQRAHAQIDAFAGRGILQETVVEAYVVRDQHGTFEQFQQPGQHLGQARGSGDHRIVDAGELLNERRDAAGGVDQGVEPGDLTPVLDAHRGDFGDAVAHRVGAGGFQVEQHVAGQHVGIVRHGPCMP